MKFKIFFTIAAFATTAISVQASEIAPTLPQLVESLDAAARSTISFVARFIDTQNRSEKFSDQINQANIILAEIKKLNGQVKVLSAQMTTDAEKEIVVCVDAIADLIIPSLENLCRAMESQRGQTDTAKLSAALKPSLTNMAAQGPSLKAKVDQLHKLLSTVYVDAANKVAILKNDIINTVNKIDALNKNKMAYVNLFAALSQRLKNG